MSTQPPPPISIPGQKPSVWIGVFRPRQSIKNVFCLAGVLFGPGRLLEGRSWLIDLATVFVFVLASSSVYLFNDILDRERDRLHPRKRNRPIANGRVSLTTALGLAALLVGLAVAGAAWLSASVLVCTVLYLANNVAYTLWLKHMALFDVLSIAFGFVLRLLAGIYALGDVPTAWITLCTFFLSTFLGFCKRRAELALLVTPEGSENQRPVLTKYSLQYLDHLMDNSAVMTIICYAIFTTVSDKNPSLLITIPIVFFAVMHYKRLVMAGAVGEEPESTVVRDLWLLGSGILWLIAYFSILYANLQLFR